MFFDFLAHYVAADTLSNRATCIALVNKSMIRVRAKFELHPRNDPSFRRLLFTTLSPVCEFFPGAVGPFALKYSVLEL